MINPKIYRNLRHDAGAIHRLAPFDSHGIEVDSLPLLERHIGCELADELEFICSTNREGWQWQIIRLGQERDIARELNIWRNRNCSERVTELFRVKTPSREGRFGGRRKVAGVGPVWIELLIWLSDSFLSSSSSLSSSSLSESTSGGTSTGSVVARQ